MFDYDTPAARAKFRSFKARLTRMKLNRNHAGIIALWAEFEGFYNSRNWPLPDNWRRWEQAAEDAKFALSRPLTLTGGWRGDGNGRN